MKDDKSWIIKFNATIDSNGTVVKTYLTPIIESFIKKFTTEGDGMSYAAWLDNWKYKYNN
ncbi:hypothetical protein ACJDU8_07375 [Clostridium sp. WILCCON 0269]|uniref:Uncharacterized protein n=1 Tax=Candidatus Clostridium eludens TaxID=3381663 RepID=A0ABW8SHY4_9CLOT